MKYILVFVFILSSVLAASSQVTFTEQPEGRKLMDHYVSVGQGDDVIDGWRIKVISTTNRRAVESAEYKFRSEYPGYAYKRDYEAPYYSLKVGAYETRFDVEPMLVKFKRDFSSAIPFRDRITKRELFAQDGE